MKVFQRVACYEETVEEEVKNKTLVSYSCVLMTRIFDIIWKPYKLAIDPVSHVNLFVIVYPTPTPASDNILSMYYRHHN